MPLALRTRASLIMVLGSFLGAGTSHAQYLGFSGSFAVGVLEGATSTAGWESYCLCQTRGTSLAQQAILGAMFRLRPDGRSPGASARIGVGTGLTQYISAAYPSQRPDMPPESTLEYRERLRTIVMHADVEGRLPIGGDAWITLGPWIDYRLQSTMDRNEHVIAPATALFPNGRGERSVVERPPDDVSAVRVGGSFGAALDLEVSQGVFFVPHLTLHAEAASLSEDRPGALMLAAGSSVVFDSRRKASSVALVDTLELPAPEPAPPRVTVDLHASDNGAIVQIAHVRRELVYRKTALPAILAIPIDDIDRTASYHARSGPGVFTLDSLIGLHPDEIDRRALDVIGFRMVAAPRSRIRLVGTYGSTERAIEGTSPAQRVADHLRSVWGIVSDRISTGAIRSDGEREVRLSGTDVTGPIVVEWLDERFHLPQIGITPTIDAPRGIRSSTLRITHRGRTLADVPMQEAGRVPEIAIDLADAASSSSVDPLRAELVVVDSSGAEARATDDLPLDLPADTATQASREIITLAIDECAPDAPCADAIVDELRNSIRSGARVTLHIPSAIAASTQSPTETFLTRLRAVFASTDVTISEVREPRSSRRIVLIIDQPVQR